MLTKILNGCQEPNGLEWRALYRMFIPRIFHLILQETIYGSISDGGRKTVCILEAALIYAGCLMFSVLKGLNYTLNAGFSVELLYTRLAED